MSTKKIKITINNKNIEVKEGITILEAAKEIGLNIPTLCYFKDLDNIGECRMCIVKVEGKKDFVTACNYKVEEGMVITTHSPEILEARKTTLDLIISDHNKDCPNCTRLGRCELQTLAAKYNITVPEFQGEKTKHIIDDQSVALVKEYDKCVLCQRCLAVCNNVQKVGAISCVNKGFETSISPEFKNSFKDSSCTYCGQCIQVCPTASIHEKETIKELEEKLQDEDTYVVVQTAPSIRVALGEEFNMPIGTNVTGKMVTALRKLGFNKVFDTNTGADFTIVEEANEFIDRLKNNVNLPMITSCCPSWVRYNEIYYPELVNHLSSCKSPHQMLGALIKTYFAQKENINPEKIYTVSIMPCIAKKYEITRKEMSNNGLYDVDNVITTRELAKLIKKNNIKFLELEDSKFDNPLGESSGAGAIFGTTGGVMEAALRTTQEKLTGKDLAKIEYEQIRGEAEIRKATINIGKQTINVAVANGLKNAKIIMEEIKSGKADYQFVEVMACPGGCIMGGGQPIKTEQVQEENDIKKLRASSLYSIDEKLTIRKSHENPTVKKVYKEFLEKPGSYRAEKLLHVDEKSHIKSPC